VDPSVEFGLRFETQEKDDDDSAPMAEDVDPDPDEAGPKKDADVVSLDSFRK